MSSIKFNAELQDAQFQAKMAKMTDSIKNAGSAADNAIGAVEKRLAGLMTIGSVGALVTKIANVRGEFQQLEVAFKTMLGNEEKAAKLMAEVTKMAATTPFDLQGVANGAKQLLAYGSEAEHVVDEMTRLGNIASGLSIPLGDMVYLYGTTRTQGRLFTQDLRQFMGRGIPLAEELAKQFGVTKDEVGGLVTAGKVGFPEVEKAIIAMTNEGGKFYNLMAEQSKTISGQIFSLGDAFSQMYNNIGESSQGIISGALTVAAKLVENYETVGKILMELIGTYGIYKTTLMGAVAVQNAHNVALRVSALTQKSTSASMVALGKQVKLIKSAFASLNKTMLANPYVALAAAVAGIGFGMYKLITYETEAEKAQRKLNDAVSEADAAASTEISALARLKGQLQAAKEGTQEYNDIKKQIVDKFGQYDSTLAQEGLSVDELASKYDGLKTAIIASYNARQYDKFKKEQEESLEGVMSENLGKLKDKLIKELGDEAGMELYTGIRDKMLEGSLSASTSFSGPIKGLSSKEQQLLTQAQTSGFINPNLNKYIDNVIKAMTLTDELDKKARQEFGIDTRVDSRNGLIGPVKPVAEEEKGISEEEKAAAAKAAAEREKMAEARKKLISDLADDVAEAERTAGEIELKAQIEANNSLIGSLTYTDGQYNSLLEKRAELAKKAAQQDYDKAKSDAQKQYNDDTKGFEKDPEVVAIAQQKYAQAIANANALLLQSIADADKEYEKTSEDMLKATEESRKAYLSQYGDFIDKLGILAEKAQNATTEWDKKAAEKEIEDLFSSDFLKTQIKEILPLFDNLSELTSGELSKVANLIEGLKIDDATLAKLKEAGVDIDKLRQELEKLKNSASEQISVRQLEKVLTLTKSIGSAISQAGQSLSGLSGEWGELGGALSALGGGVNNLSDLFQSLKENTGSDGKLNAQGKGAAISTAITGTIQMVAMVGEQIQKNKAYQEQFNASVRQAEHEYTMLQLKKLDYDQRDIFSTQNPYQRAIDGAKQYSAAMGELAKLSSELEDGQVQTGTKKVVNWSNVGQGAAIGASVGLAVGSVVPVIGSAIGTAVGTVIGGLTGLFASKKKVAVYESLKDKYGEIYDPETFELNEQIIADYDKMDDATKQLIDNWQEIKEKAEEAHEQLLDNIEDLAGDLGSKLSDALAKAYRNGNVYDAIDEFNEYANQSIQDIIDQLLFSATLGPLLTELRQRMENSFKEGEDGSIIDDIQWFKSQLPGAVSNYKASADVVKQEMGDEFFKPDAQDRSSAAKGIAQASQDSVDELNGRFTVIQSHTFRIANTIEVIASKNNAIGTDVSEAVGVLSDIRLDTARLAKIEDYTRLLQNSVDYMTKNGMDLKR